LSLATEILEFACVMDVGGLLLVLFLKHSVQGSLAERKADQFHVIKAGW
jgi:hypothetical protein